MKCIQAIRETKYSSVGDIKRVTEVEADEKVSTGYWKFVPKMEWKLATRSKKVEEVVNPQITDAVTISEKQLNKKKKNK
jgi:hypothetical protein